MDHDCLPSYADCFRASFHSTVLSKSPKNGSKQLPGKPGGHLVELSSKGARNKLENVGKANDATEKARDDVTDNPVNQGLAISSSGVGGVSVLDLPSYLFKGVLISFKMRETLGLGFVRSCQVSGDVYINTARMGMERKDFSSCVGRTVLFTVQDAGSSRTSLEARNMALADESVAHSLLVGKIVAWDGSLGQGWVEVEQTEMRLVFSKEELDKEENKTLVVGRKVRFELFVDRNLNVEARKIKLSKSFTASVQPSSTASRMEDSGSSMKPLRRQVSESESDNEEENKSERSDTDGSFSQFDDSDDDPDFNVRKIVCNAADTDTASEDENSTKTAKKANPKGRSKVKIPPSSKKAISATVTKVTKPASAPTVTLPPTTHVAAPVPAVSMVTKCKTCGKFFTHLGSLMKHSKKCGQTYKCFKCGVKFKCLKYLKSHAVNKHSDPKFSCEMCDMKFRTKSKLISHVKTHDSSVVCPLCSKRFKSKQVLKVHKSFKHGKTEKTVKIKWPCLVCPKVFKSDRGLRKHKELHKMIAAEEMSSEEVQDTPELIEVEPNSIIVDEVIDNILM